MIEFLTNFLPLFCVVTASIALVVSSVIDLKIRILPDYLTVIFFLSGIAFHFFTDFRFLELKSAVTGMIACFTLLYVTRAVANHIYKRDTLGLGDVKLMGAAGFWLGVDYIFIALAGGAILSLIHGVVHALMISYKDSKKVDIGKFAVPAGPGLSAGILVMIYYLFL